MRDISKMIQFFKHKCLPSPTHWSEGFINVRKFGLSLRYLVHVIFTFNLWYLRQVFWIIEQRPVQLRPTKRNDEQNDCGKEKQHYEWVNVVCTALSLWLRTVWEINDLFVAHAHLSISHVLWKNDLLLYAISTVN